MLAAIHNALLSLTYPQECRVCGNSVESSRDGIACDECWSQTRVFSGNEMLCRKCGAFFADVAAPIPVSCHKCDAHYYDMACAVGIYEKALAASIIHLKAVPLLPLRLRGMIGHALKEREFTADVIIPIPLSLQRRHERGFNQAEVISREMSRMVRIPIDAGSLARTFHTPIHRVAMDEKARELSVRNAFQVKRPKLIEGKVILLVDDVFTSGATASNCAKALKKNGARQVYVFTLARAVLG